MAGLETKDLQGKLLEFRGAANRKDPFCRNPIHGQCLHWPGDRLLPDGCDARECFPFNILKHGSSTRGNIAYLVLDIVFVHGGY
jgi:hypothetical protein